jgi:hypothetical protein
MINRAQDDKSKPTICDLYPSLSEQQAMEAEESLSRYLQLALEIYKRIREDPQIYAKFKDLTGLKSHPSMHATGSNPTNESLLIL